MPKIKPQDTPKKFNTELPDVELQDPIESNYRIESANYDNTCHAPTQLIIKYLTDYFTNIDSGPIFNIYDKEIFGYNREDVQITGVPALNIFMNSDRARRKQTDIGYYTGYINLDSILPLMTQRDRYTEVTMNIHDLFFNLFINPSGNLFRAIYNDMPYLKFLGCDFEAKDYIVKNIKDCFVYRIIIDFVIDIQSYLCWLENNGYDMDDPCNQIPFWGDTILSNKMQPYQLDLL